MCYTTIARTGSVLSGGPETGQTGLIGAKYASVPGFPNEYFETYMLTAAFLAFADLELK